MKLVVFDMDGTLIDTQGLIAEQMGVAFTSLGLPAPTPEQSRRVIGLSLPVAIGRLAASEDGALIERLVESYRTSYRSIVEDVGDREPLFPGTRAMLDRLHADDGTLLGIATGKGLNGVNRILGNHGLDRHFVTLQTPDHNPSKPHPGMLLRAMSETGAAPKETIMVGDTTFDIELAKAAGVTAIGVSWGYHDTDELVAAGASAIIDHYDELDETLVRLLS